MLQNGIKIIEVFVGETNSVQVYYSHYSKAILDDLKKHFHHEIKESFPDIRFILLETRANLFRHVNMKP